MTAVLLFRFCKPATRHTNFNHQIKTLDTSGPLVLDGSLFHSNQRRVTFLATANRRQQDTSFQECANSDTRLRSKPLSQAVRRMFSKQQHLLQTSAFVLGLIHSYKVITIESAFWQLGVTCKSVETSGLVWNTLNFLQNKLSVLKLP